MNKFLTEGVGIVKGRLEIIASDTFLVPWRGDVKINGPVKMTVEEEKPAFEYIPEEEPVESVYEDEDHLKRLLSLEKEDMKEKVKDKEMVETEETFSVFLNTPIEELI